MKQVQQQPDTPAKAPNRAMSILFDICSWVWGSMAIIGGARSIARSPVIGSVMMALGVVLLSPIRNLIARITSSRTAYAIAVGSGLAILVLIAPLSGDLRSAQNIEALSRTRLADGQRCNDSLILARYPFVDRDSLAIWSVHAADSVTNRDYTFAAFLQRQETYHRRRLADSVARVRKLRANSITLARRQHADSIAQARSQRGDTIISTRRRPVDSVAVTRELDTAPEMYNGHIIYTGPRGGKYYINSNGNKTYLPH